MQIMLSILRTCAPHVAQRWRHMWAQSCPTCVARLFAFAVVQPTVCSSAVPSVWCPKFPGTIHTQKR